MWDLENEGFEINILRLKKTDPEFRFEIQDFKSQPYLPLR
jgi:hypothetical protein